MSPVEWALEWCSFHWNGGIFSFCLLIADSTHDQGWLNAGVSAFCFWDCPLWMKLELSQILHCPSCVRHSACIRRKLLLMLPQIRTQEMQTVDPRNLRDTPWPIRWTAELLLRAGAAIIGRDSVATGEKSSDASVLKPRCLQGVSLNFLLGPWLQYSPELLRLRRTLTFSTGSMAKDVRAWLTFPLRRVCRPRRSRLFKTLLNYSPIYIVYYTIS